MNKHHTTKQKDFEWKCLQAQVVMSTLQGQWRKDTQPKDKCNCGIWQVLRG